MNKGRKEEREGGRERGRETGGRLKDKSNE